MNKLGKLLVSSITSFLLLVGFATVTSAESSSPHEAPPSSMVVSETDISNSSSVPEFIIFDDFIDGYHYRGILDYVSQQYNPEIGYITLYRGTVYLQ